MNLPLTGPCGRVVTSGLIPGRCHGAERSSSYSISRLAAFFSTTALLCIALWPAACGSVDLRVPSGPGRTHAGWRGERAIDPSGVQLTGRGLASAGGQISQPTAPSAPTTVATFRVLETIGGADNRWTVAGSGLTSTLGPGVLWDSSGSVVGYRVLPRGGHVTVSSDTWYGHASMILTGVSQATYAVALYANNTNPALRPDPSGMITPGYVPDLSAYNAGTGPGWVAVDSSTGNALLLSVRASVVGTPVVTDQYGNTTGSTLLSPLGARTTEGVVSALGPNDSSFATTFPGAISSNNPPAVFGCNVPHPNEVSNSTCTGGNLHVDITPVVVVRGDVVGVRTSPAASSAHVPGSWSPSGTYSLNLSGLLVIA